MPGRPLLCVAVVFALAVPAGAANTTCQPAAVSTPVVPQIVESMPGPDRRILFSEANGVFGTIAANGTVTKHTITPPSDNAYIVNMAPIDGNRAYIGWLHSTPQNPNNNQIASYISEVNVVTGARTDHALPDKDLFAVGRSGSAIDSTGGLWVGGNWRGYLMEFRGGQFKKHDPLTLTIADVAISADGAVWTGQYGIESIARFNPFDKTFQKFPSKDGNPEYVISLAAGSDDTMWGSEVNFGWMKSMTSAGSEYRDKYGTVAGDIKASPDNRMFVATVDERIGWFNPKVKPISLEYVPSGVQGSSMAFRTRDDGNFDLFVAGRKASTGKDALVQCSVTSVTPPTPKPKLTVTLSHTPQLILPVNGTFDAAYEIVVKNVGDAPTSGLVTVRLDLTAPEDGDAFTFRFDPGRWLCAPLSCTILMPPILPGEEADLGWVVRHTLVRGTYSTVAVVTGGGSPEAWSTPDNIVIDPRLAGAIPASQPKKIPGRKR